VGADATVTIKEVPESLHKEKILAVLAEQAMAAEINIYKIDADRRQPDSVRILHEFVGNPSSTVGGAARDYPSFSPFFTTRIEPASDITTEDVRGVYAIYGTVAQADALVADLGSVGVTAAAEPANAADAWRSTLLGKTPLAGLVGIGAFTLVLGSAMFATGRRKVSATRAIFGTSRVKSLGKDYLAALKMYLVPAIVISAAATLGVGVATEFNQFWPFLHSASLLLGAGIPIILVGVTLVFLTSRRIGMSQVINGEKPWVTLRLLSASTTALSFGLVFAIVGSLSAAALSTAEKSRFDESWRNVGESVTLRFAGTTTAADFTALTERFGEIYRKHENGGRVVLAKPPTVPRFRAASYGPFDGNSLIVNPEYLNRNTILDASSQRVEAPDLMSGEMVLLIPSTIWNMREKVASEYKEWATFQRSLTDFDTPLQIRVVETRRDQEAFNYGSNNFRFGNGQKNAVIAVLSTKSEIVPAEFYVTAASNAAVIFDSAEDLQSSLAQSGVSKYISAIDSANGLALNAQAERQGLMIALALCLAVLLPIIFVSTAITIWAYLERQRSLIMVRTLHGFSFLARHQGLLLLSTSTVTALVLANVLLGALSSELAFAGALVVLILHAAGTVTLLRSGEGSLATRLQAGA
jgi:hypothetical protein